jgi:diacylglycerol kinase
MQHIVEFFRTRITSFRNAFSGFWYVVRTQKNAWIHLLATIMVILLSFWLWIEPVQWALIFICIGLVWFAEFINTALEAVVDLASPQKHPLAKVGKDVGAAAVLIAAIASTIIGVLVLGPPLLDKIGKLLH